jgi:hypothetical protein
VLAIISHEVETSYVLELLDALTNPFPAPVMATIVDQDDLVAEAASFASGNQPLAELFDRTLAVVHWHHHGHGGASTGKG